MVRGENVLHPPVTDVFRSPPLVSGTVFRSTRHVSTVTGHLPQSPQDSSLQALLSTTFPLFCLARKVTCHYGHVNRFRYLLTYLPHERGNCIRAGKCPDTHGAESVVSGGKESGRLAGDDGATRPDCRRVPVVCCHRAPTIDRQTE